MLSIEAHDCGDYPDMDQDRIKPILVHYREVPTLCKWNGWTVIQSRGQFSWFPKDYFSTKLWEDYRIGFGVPGQPFLNYILRAIVWMSMFSLLLIDWFTWLLCKFISLGDEFWLGLDNIYELTQVKNYTLRVTMETFDGIIKTAFYTDFKLLDNVRN